MSATAKHCYAFQAVHCSLGPRCRGPRIPLHLPCTILDHVANGTEELISGLQQEAIVAASPACARGMHMMNVGAASRFKFLEGKFWRQCFEPLPLKILVLHLQSCELGHSKVTSRRTRSPGGYLERQWWQLFFSFGHFCCSFAECHL